MIEVNLLPDVPEGLHAYRPEGDPPHVAGRAKCVAYRKAASWPMMAIGSVGVGVAVVVLLRASHIRRASDLAVREQRARHDSAHIALQLRARLAVERTRDSAQRQLARMNALDNARRIWPHILDEISEALPRDAWLRSVVQSSPIASQWSGDSTVTLQMVGQTLDIRALTQFMKSLGESPYFSQVVLVRSDVVPQQGTSATEFRLDLQYRRPISSVIPRSAQDAPVRERK